SSWYFCSASDSSDGCWGAGFGAAAAEVPGTLAAAATTPAASAPDRTRFTGCDDTSPRSPLRHGHLTGATNLVRSGALTRRRITTTNVGHHALITRCQPRPVAVTRTAPRPAVSATTRRRRPSTTTDHRQVSNRLRNTSTIVHTRGRVFRRGGVA